MHLAGLPYHYEGKTSVMHHRKLAAASAPTLPHTTDKRTPGCALHECLENAAFRRPIRLSPLLLSSSAGLEASASSPPPADAAKAARSTSALLCCRLRFHSPGGHKWQRVHWSPFVQPRLCTNQQGLHSPLAWRAEPRLGSSCRSAGAAPCCDDGGKSGGGLMGTSKCIGAGGAHGTGGAGD